MEVASFSSIPVHGRSCTADGKHAGLGRIF
jgi:hypothetical protein